jgi:MIP family channel proteins
VASNGGGSSGLYGSTAGSQAVRPAIAEVVGTFMLVFVGCAVAVAASLKKPVAGGPYDSLAVVLAFGLALLIVVAAIGHVSGGHVNPAVTLGQAVTGKFPWRQVPLYIVAQVVGAVLAALAVWLIFGDPGRDRANLASPAPASGVGVGQAFAVEAFITFILVFVVVLVASDPRVPSSTIAPIAVGFALAAGIFVGGPLTGAAVNPARAIGPMIVAGQFGDLWLYLVAPILGGVVAAPVADFLLRGFQMEQEDDEPGGGEGSEREATGARRLSSPRLP